MPDHEQSGEDLYDAEIAPALLAIMQRCKEAGMPFVATVEYEPGCFGTSVHLPEGASLPVTWAYVSARSNGNADVLINHLIKQAQERGHGSFFLAQLGVPPLPKGGTDA